MKLKFLILIALVLSFIGIVNPMKVNAATDRITEGDWIPGIYINRVTPTGINYYQTAQWILRTSDSKFVYCIQPGVAIDNNLIYQVYESPALSNITQAQWDRIVLLAHYGYGYNQSGYNHTSTAWYVITQVEIWKIAAPGWDIYYTDSLNGNRISRYVAEAAELNKLVNDHYKVPSFNNSNHTLTVGSSITLTDTNGVLNNYNVTSNDNVEVVRNGNELIITAKAVGTTTLTLSKTSNKWSTPPLVYVQPNSQNVMSVGDYDPMYAQLNLDIIGGSIGLSKIDYDNNNKTTQGKATLSGAVYEVYDSDRILVRTLITDSNGNASLEGLELGTYYIREKTPSTGYLLDANEYVIEITEGNLDHNIVSKEQVIKGRISINKRDLENNSAIPQGDAIISGAVYQIRNSSNAVVATLTTNSSGYAISGLLPYDDYTIKEITPSTGYLLDGTTYYVSVTQNNVTYNKISLEQVIKGRIKIDKLDYGNDSKVPCGEGKLNGAVYDIYLISKGQLVDTIMTDQDGYALSKLLPYGNYMIKERTASEGYLVDLTEHQQFISVNGTTYTITSKEIIIRRDIELTKSYSQQETGILAPENNIVFDFYNKWGEKVASVTTDSSGYAKVYGLPYGHYIVRQANSPSGVEKMQDFTFFVSGNSPEPIRYNIVNNSINAYLRLVKIDNISKEIIPLAGIKFKIWSIDREEFVSMTVMYPTPKTIDVFETNEDGYFVTPQELEIGNYKIIELDQKIDGYLYNTEHFYFNIDGEADIEIDFDYGNLITVYFENQRVTSKLEVIKNGQELVIENGTYKYVDIELANVKFNVYSAEDVYHNGKLVYAKDTLIDTLITDEDGNAILNIPYLGKFYILEIETVGNNVLNSNPVYYEFNYKDQYTPIIEVIKWVDNEYERGTFEFTKIDIADSTPLPNTIIEIYTINDELVFTGITNEYGKIVIEDLFVGKFYIVEKEALTGYKLNDEKVFFEISEHGEIVKAEMTNEKIKGNVEIIKVDSKTHETLANTVIEVYTEDDELVFTGTTDEMGKLLVENLEYGKYYILESVAPEGYHINPEKIFFEIIEDGVTVELVLIDDKIIEIPKTFMSKSMIPSVLGIVFIIGGLIYVSNNKNKRK